MTKKTKKAYLAVFKYIEDKLFKLKPAQFMTDYEDGMRSAIRKYWSSNVTIRGCFFHFCQAILRRCRKLGMVRFLKNSENGRRIQKSLMSLPLLPADSIQEGYESIKHFTRENNLWSNFSPLFAYFDRYWLIQVYE